MSEEAELRAKIAALSGKDSRIALRDASNFAAGRINQQRQSESAPPTPAYAAHPTTQEVVVLDGPVNTRLIAMRHTISLAASRTNPPMLPRTAIAPSSLTAPSEPMPVSKPLPPRLPSRLPMASS
jgi:hypothetical protein